MIRRAGRDDHQIKLRGFDSGVTKRGARGAFGQIGRRLVRRGDAALGDTGARANPFIVGFDDLRQLVVGDDALRQKRADAGNARRMQRVGIGNHDSGFTLRREYSQGPTGTLFFKSCKF